MEKPELRLIVNRSKNAQNNKTETIEKLTNTENDLIETSRLFEKKQIRGTRDERIIKDLRNQLMLAEKEIKAQEKRHWITILSVILLSIIIIAFLKI